MFGMQPEVLGVLPKGWEGCKERVMWWKAGSTRVPISLVQVAEPQRGVTIKPKVATLG